MRIKILILLSLISFQISFAQKVEKGNLVMENIPEIPASIIDKTNQYQNIRSASFLNYAPDGKTMLLATRFADASQLHIIDHPGGARKQITFFKDAVSNAIFFPEENKFVFLKDSGGNEFTQLYSFDLSNGNYKLISDGGRSQNSLPKWSNSGKQFTTISTKRNGKDYDIYIGNTTTSTDTKLILSKGGSWSAGDWSPDDKKIIVRNGISATKSFMHIMDIETGTLTEISSSEEETSFSNAMWSADGKGIYLVNDEGSEFSQLKYFDVTTKKSKIITTGIKWDVGGISMNKKRNKLLFSVNENGYSKIYKLDLATNAYSELKNFPIGLFSGIEFNPVNDSEIALTISTAQTPGDIYTYDWILEKLTRWTYSEVGGLNTDAFTIPTLVTYPTFDKTADGKQRTIPAFYYKPKTSTGKIPVIIIIHGGPEGQSRPSFSSFNSLLNNELGVAVIAPNVRGSSGYGKSYLKMDNGMLREESVKDIGALIDWIAKQPELDASRICVYGGSYGGYMVLASLTHYSDKLKCGIDVVGISNFVTFLKNTEAYRRDLRRVEYGDEQIPEMNAFLEKISPLNNVEKITKPLFIVQGQNDPRVPFTEAEQMKNKLQQAGKPVWYLLAKDEGHGFRKKANSDFQQWAMIMFLKEYLLK
jgi:dipeptidyl aminopeptidase/acylaminoacyl peptidase